MGADEADGGAVGSSGRLIFVDRAGFIEVIDDEVDIAIAIEIAGGGAEADGLAFQAPRLADVIELKAPCTVWVGPGIAEGSIWVAFGGGGKFFPSAAGGDEIGVEEISGHAVGDVEIEPSIAVEVDQLGGPCPVGGGDAELMGAFEEWSAVSGIEVNGIAHVLTGGRNFEKPSVFIHVAHAHLIFVMVGAGHV